LFDIQSLIHYVMAALPFQRGPLSDADSPPHLRSDPGAHPVLLQELSRMPHVDKQGQTQD
jgi:hypothetical protein